MPTICPHCRAVRPENTQAPDWQCPSCGKAYAKAGSGVAAVRTPQPVVSSGAATDGSNFAWGKLLVMVAIVYGVWVGWHKVGGVGGLSPVTRLTGNPSAAQLTQLASSRQASDVLMYSADWCPNCRAAKGWMQQYGFKFEECNVETNSACASQLRFLDPQGGVPYLIVRGHHMKEGFDSDEFVAALGK